jgi:hypothetical protein
LYERIVDDTAFGNFPLDHSAYANNPAAKAAWPALRKQIKGFFNMEVLKIKASNKEKDQMRELVLPINDVSELHDPSTKVVARNWMKGMLGYEVCAQWKCGWKLNKVEHMVGVLLHEVVHSMHLEHESTAIHGVDFYMMNDFLVGFARCEISQASGAEQRKWDAWQGDLKCAVSGKENLACMPFDTDVFNTSCGGDASVRFCGLKVRIGSCSTKCKGG